MAKPPLSLGDADKVNPGWRATTWMGAYLSLDATTKNSSCPHFFHYSSSSGYVKSGVLPIHRCPRRLATLAKLVRYLIQLFPSRANPDEYDSSISPPNSG